MSNFEKLTASPEVLGKFLASIPVVASPWDDAFYKEFCSVCDHEDCDDPPCPHQAERNDPVWWLKEEAEEAPLATLHTGAIWADGTSPQIVCEHYGYTDREGIQDGHHGYWPKETLMERTAEIPEFLRISGLEKEKFRLVIDYDPEFPRALIHIQTERRTGQPSGGTPEEAKSSLRSQ